MLEANRAEEQKTRRSELHALACNFANFVRILALPERIEHRSVGKKLIGKKDGCDHWSCRRTKTGYLWAIARDDRPWG